MNEEAIFESVIQKQVGERGAFLEQVCGDNESLRRRIDRLVTAHESPAEFLPAEPPVLDSTNWSGGVEMVDQTIGRYRLREQIGEGGMGVVFVAEQERPVRRKVALKVIKAGMDTKEVVARFSAERQALALMDHPNIAKVFDAGSTESGRPYFVMELVRGIPITEYCNKKRLTIGERLKLFVQVCESIQHAHQKGIIHRDIKPSNVMVTEHGGRAVPKVIDFGVAKATNQRLTEQTIYTRFQQIIGTPMYMSPEQAELSGLDVDTRSDIYALGVLLYELVVGVPPFERDRLERAAYDEMRRIIREEEPPTPSTRLTSLGSTANTVSAERGTDPDRLRRQIQGDLDWIVVRAMEKDPTRRYDSATAMADDIQRYLSDEIVEARPPSRVYRFRKFVRRNKVAVSTATIAFAALATGLGFALWGLGQARVEAANSQLAEDRVTNTLSTLAEVVFEEAMSAALSGTEKRTRELIEIGRTSQLSNDRLVLIEATLEFVRGNNDRTIALLSDIVAEHREDVSVIGLLSAAHLLAAHDSQALHYLDQVNQLEPQTAEDFLFKGIAQTDVSAGLPLVERGMRQRPSAGALVTRATERSWLAVDADDVELAQAALVDAQAAALLLGDTTTPLMTQMHSHHFLSKRMTGEQRAFHVRSAQEMADSLARTGDTTDWFTPLYLADIGETNAALAAWRETKLEGSVLSQYIAALLQRTLEDPQAALDQFDALIPDHSNPYVLVARAHLLAEIPSKRHELPEVLARVQHAAGDSAPLQYQVLQLYFLMGDLDGQLAAAQALRELDPDAFRHWGMRLSIEFLSGECDEKRIRDTVASAQGSNFRACSARKNIGMRLLLLAEREKAREQFAKCVETGVWYFFDYNWSKAYLARMDADPDWPHWLPTDATE